LPVAHTCRVPKTCTSAHALLVAPPRMGRIPCSERVRPPLFTPTNGAPFTLMRASRDRTNRRACGRVRLRAVAGSMSLRLPLLLLLAGPHRSRADATDGADGADGDADLRCSACDLFVTHYLARCFATVFAKDATAVASVYRVRVAEVYREHAPDKLYLVEGLLKKARRRFAPCHASSSLPSALCGVDGCSTLPAQLAGPATAPPTPPFPARGPAPAGPRPGAQAVP
jgi:hypothetical protein